MFKAFTINKRRLGGLILLLSWAVSTGVWPKAASQSGAELGHTQAQLKAAAEADLLLLLNEAAINQAAQSLVGLEVTLANGAVLHLKAINMQLKAAAAEVMLEVQAQASPTSKVFNLQLTGVLGNAEPKDGALQLPFRLTEISLANGLLTPLLRLWFGEWLAPERWNAALPALTLPRELTEQIEIPATQFEVKGALPMIVTTTAYQLPLKFSFAAFCILDGRAAIALRLLENEFAREPLAIGADLAQLSEQLSTPRALRARITKPVIGQLLARLAAARTDDLQLQLQPARVRQEQPGGLLAVTNYTDLESGTAQADVRQIIIDRIDGDGLETRLQAQGVFDTKLRGREYGIPYRLSPRGTFSINDRRVPLRVAGATERIFLQAAPGTTLPLDLRFQFGLAGRAVGFDRQVSLPAERVFHHLELPSFDLRKLPLPRKLTAEKTGKLNVTEQRELNLQLSGLQVRAQTDAIEFTSELAVRE
jgi:hypothetical protein